MPLKDSLLLLLLLKDDEEEYSLVGLMDDEDATNGAVWLLVWQFNIKITRKMPTWRISIVVLIAALHHLTKPLQRFAERAVTGAILHPFTLSSSSVT